MQSKEAKKLKHKWGNKPCAHPNLSKEFHSGASTGDYFCNTCGEIGFGRNWVKQKSLTPN